jgi:hypothetical protein
VRPLGQDLRDLLGLLDKHHVRYMVVGGFGFASLGLTASDLVQADVVIQLGYEPNRVDLLTGLSGVLFEDVYPKRVFTTIDGIQVPIIDRSSLIANKRALGRAQDLADAEALDR